MNDHKIPRNEYPRPQFVRDAWLCLNGEWEHEADRGESGKERKFYERESLDGKITVPFCRESKLSGIGDTDFCDCVWYRKEVYLPQGWLDGGKRTILHIGACDFLTDVWVNAKYVGNHIGGYVSFSFDITDSLTAGKNVITVCASDHTRSKTQPAGKQSQKYSSYGCFYTRTTGIWQTVWLENVPENYIKSVKYFPSVSDSKITIEAETACNSDGTVLRAEAFFDGKAVGAAATAVEGRHCVLEMKLDELHLWEIGKGDLYDIEFSFGDDRVRGYFGMRSIELGENGMLILNGKKVFQRLILDQGFYPDGIYTAPSDEELLGDIKRSMACGFNGARLHQKIFEPRFLSYCDKMGYIVWGEHGNWGLDISKPEAWQGFIPEWIEAVERDFNHPAIIGWCPLNETDKNQNPEFVKALSRLTRTLDPTRLYIDASGWEHVKGADGVTDILDMHYYEQDPEVFSSHLEPLLRGEPIELYKYNRGTSFIGKPTFMSEYGGIRWSVDGSGWGYGNGPQTPEEFVERFKGLTEVLLKHPMITGLCYTQLTDVEQEVNGLYTYDRQPKFDVKLFAEVLSQKAASED